MRGSLSFLPLSIRLPLGLSVFVVMMLVQAMVVSNVASVPASSMDYESRFEQREDREIVRSVIGEPVHMKGTYYPEEAAEQMEPDTSSGDVWIWASIAFGALLTAFLLVGAAFLGLFSPLEVSTEERLEAFGGDGVE